jgi:hypothetical protein
MGKRREARIRIAEEDGVLRVTIPMPRRWHHLVGSAVGALVVVAWGVGIPVVTVGTFLGWPALAPEPPQTYMPLAGLLFVLVPWLIMWLGGVAWFLFNLLWERYGREVLLIDNDTLTLRREEPLYASNERFDVSGVHSLRAVSRGAGYYLSLYPWAADIIYHPWHLAFEYGGDTIRFAGALDGEEAQRTVDDIAARVPSLVEVGGAAERPLAPKATITEADGGLKVVMRVRPPLLGTLAVWGMAAFAGGWLWLVCSPGRSRDLGVAPVWAEIMAVTWLCLVGVLAYWVLWLLLGREIALVDEANLTIKRVMLVCVRTKVFDMRDVRALCVMPERGTEPVTSSWRARMQAASFAPFGLGGDHLAFDYQGRTIRLGVGIHPAEARRIVHKIGARFPLLVEQGRVAEMPLVPEATITEANGGLKFVMPVRSRALGVVAVWGAAVSYGGWMTVSRGPDAFPLPGGPVVWRVHCVMGWLSAAAIWAYWVLWLLLGREVALIDEASFTLKHVTPVYTRTKVFEMRLVRNLRATPDPWPERASQSWWARTLAADLTAVGLAGGRLAFDYQGRAIHLGVGLDLAQAQRIANEIAARFPSVTETDG